MATTVPKAFDEFKDKLLPTSAQRTQLTDRRAAVEGFLRATYGANSNMPLTHLRTIGSAGRKTIIRPIDDLDVFAVFDDTNVWNSYQSDSKQLIYRVREALGEYSVETVGTRGQAVRLFYSSGPNVDITPAFPLTSVLFNEPQGYYIPSGNGGWQQTDPYAHHDFMAHRNTALGGQLKVLVRMLKRWNNVHSRRLKGFHLEVMTQAVFSGLGTNSREALEMFFDAAPNYLHVNDPAGYSGDLARGLTVAQKKAANQSFANALTQVRRARAAEANADPAEAMRQWRLVFGNEFPSHG